MMNRSDFWIIIIGHWLVFAMIIFIGWLMMSTNNLKLELQYMKDYKEGVTSENLQDLMCNGNPIK